MQKYAAFAASAFQTRLAYRGQVWAGLFGRLVTVFAWIAIWTSVYGSGSGTVEGASLQDMITYAVIGGTVANAWDWRRLLNSVGDSVNSGDVAVYLLKPLRYPIYLFATECGNLGYRLATVAAPVVVVVALVYGLRPPASLFHGLMFLPYWALSFTILFLLAALCGLLSFWLLTAFSLEWLLQGILSLLSGIYIPLWFFPDAVAEIIRFLPVSWIGFHPIAVYLGKTPVGDTLLFLALGAGWALLLAAAVGALWQRAALRITVQGG
jgi:ABC-2 type transport system permease protein